MIKPLKKAPRYMQSLESGVGAPLLSEMYHSDVLTGRGLGRQSHFRMLESLDGFSSPGAFRHGVM